MAKTARVQGESMNQIEAIKAGVLVRCKCNNRKYVVVKYEYSTTKMDKRKDSINMLIDAVINPQKRKQVRYKLLCSQCKTMWLAFEKLKEAKEAMRELYDSRM